MYARYTIHRKNQANIEKILKKRIYVLPDCEKYQKYQNFCFFESKYKYLQRCISERMDIRVYVCEKIGRSKIDRPCTLFDYYSKIAINTVNANSIAFHYSIVPINKVNYKINVHWYILFVRFKQSLFLFSTHLTFHRLVLALLE